MIYQFDQLITPYSVMESLEDFFEDAEKEYSQQVIMPEHNMIKQKSIKCRRNSFDTQKLIENQKLRDERAKNILKQYAESLENQSEKLSSKSRSKSKSTRRAKKSKLKLKKVKYHNKIKVKSDEFTLRNTAQQPKSEKLRSMMSKYKQSRPKNQSVQGFNTSRNKIMKKIKKIRRSRKVSPKVPTKPRPHQKSRDKHMTRSVIEFNKSGKSQLITKPRTFKTRRNS